jgi:hypothetical protein
MECEGCLEALDGISIIGGYRVCMPCTQARHKAVLRRKCVCRKAQRRPKQCKAGSRKWVACLRCLGSVRQLA